MPQSVQEALATLNFNQPDQVISAIAPFLTESREALDVRALLQVIHDIATGEETSVELLPFIFYPWTTAGWNKPRFLAIQALMEGAHISLKGLEITSEIKGCIVLPVVDFLQVKALQLQNPVHATYYYFRHQEQVQAPLFPFSYLENLAWEVFSLTVTHVCVPTCNTCEKNRSVIEFLKASAQQAGERKAANAPSTTVLRVEECVMLRRFIEILSRVHVFLQDSGSRSSRLYSFLRRKIEEKPSEHSLHQVYEEFCTRQNPIYAKLLDGIQALTQPMDQQWQEYACSRGYTIGKICHFLFLLLILGLIYCTQQMPSLWIFLPIVWVTMLYCGMSSKESLTVLTPFVAMPIKMGMASTVGAWLEEQSLGVKRESGLWPLFFTMATMGTDMVLHAFDVNQRSQEKERYLQAMDPNHCSSQSSLRAALTAGAGRGGMYVGWMVVPYVATRMVLALLHADRLTGLFTFHWTRRLNQLKLLISGAIAGCRYVQLRHTNHPVSRAVQRQKVSYFVVEGMMAALLLMMDTTVFNAPDERMQREMAVAVQGERQYMLFLNKQSPDSSWVDTPSDVFACFGKPRENPAWYATPHSTAQGLGAYLARSGKITQPVSLPGVPNNVDLFESPEVFWSAEYFGQKQCPRNPLEGMAELFGPQKFGVLRILSRSDAILQAQGTDHPALWLMAMTVPPQNLERAAIAMGYPPVIASVLQSIMRAVRMESVSDLVR